MSETRPLTAEDLYDLTLVADPQLSPDGRYVLFSLSRTDRKTEKKYANLWLVATDGRTPPRRFTVGDHTDTYPRWSPDGSQIAFLSNRKEASQMQIYIIPLAGGEAWPVTNAQGAFAGFAWSPDGRAFVSQFRLKDADDLAREEDEQKKKLGVVARHITTFHYKWDGAGYMPAEKWHIWTFDAETGEGKQLTAGETDETNPSWSPDGRTIVYAANRHPEPELHEDAVQFYLIPAEGGESVEVVGGHHGRKFAPSFSPDGRLIAYLGVAEPNKWGQNDCLYVVPTAGGPARNLSIAHDLHVDVASLTDVGSNTPTPAPTWSADGREIYVLASHHGNQPLLAFNVDTGDYRHVVDGQGLVGNFSFSADQNQLVYLWGDRYTTGQVRFLDVASGQSTSLTQFNQPLFDGIAWGDIEEVWFDGLEGNRLQGWILRPPGFDPAQQYPAIIQIHGGPMMQYANSLMHEFHFLAAQGFVVAYSNPRGSRGYGNEHSTTIANRWGSVDYDDIMAWTDYVEQLPYVDGNRMGVSGGSYGGYMTALIIGKTDRFKAASAQRVVSNLLSFYGSSDMNWQVENLVGLPGQPWNDFQNYWQQSPMSHIGNAKTPTLVLHSERDFRCDQEQGEQLYIALKRLGVDTELLLFPEESHGLSRNGRTDRRVARLHHLARWFNRYLKDEQA